MEKMLKTDGENLVDLQQNRNSDVGGCSKFAANIKSFVDRNLLFSAKCTTSLNDLKGGSVILPQIFKR